MPLYSSFAISVASNVGDGYPEFKAFSRILHYHKVLMTRGLTRCLALVEEAFEDKRHRCPNFSLCLLNPSTRFLRSSLIESRLHKLMAITRYTNRCTCRERWRLSRLPACSMILVGMAVSQALKTSPDLICGKRVRIRHF